MIQFLFALFIFSVSHVMAQKGDIKVTSAVKAAGTVMATGETISAVEYVIPDRIQTYHIDTTLKRLTVQLRGLNKSGKWLNNKGTILSYDLNDKKVLWTKGVAFQVEGYEQFGSTIIRTSANKSNFINPDNGTPAWEVKNTIYHVDPIDNIGIGYKVKSSSGVTNTLEGIDLSSGKEIWKRELNREYGWNDLFYLNDSTLIIAAAGLHSVNINNGTGWDYHAVTGKKDYTGTIAANALGIAAGVLTGTFVTSTGHNLVRDVVSNVIVDSTHFYFASKENLARIDKKGNVSWSAPLPEKLTSKSFIFVKDKKVFVLNHGYAYMGYRKLDFGKPFFAAFNEETGKELFNYTLSEEKEAQVTGFTIGESSVYVLLQNRIEAYSLADGQKIRQKKLNEDNSEENFIFVGDQVFSHKADSTYQSLNLTDLSTINLYTDKGRVIRLNKSFDLVDEINPEGLWVNYLRKSGYSFLAKGDKTLILNSENHKVAEVTASGKSTLLGRKLYTVQENSFIETDLSKVLKE